MATAKNKINNKIKQKIKNSPFVVCICVALEIC